jgi:hypothetical protein
VINARLCGLRMPQATTTTTRKQPSSPAIAASLAPAQRAHLVPLALAQHLSEEDARHRGHGPPPVGLLSLSVPLQAGRRAGRRVSAAARSSSRGFPGAVATCCLLLLLPPLLLPPLLLPPPPLLPAAGAPSGGQHRCQGQGGLQAGEEEELVRREGGGQAKPMPCSAACAVCWAAGRAAVLGPAAKGSLLRHPQQCRGCDLRPCCPTTIELQCWLGSVRSPKPKSAAGKGGKRQRGQRAVQAATGLAMWLILATAGLRHNVHAASAAFPLLCSRWLYCLAAAAGGTGTRSRRLSSSRCSLTACKLAVQVLGGDDACTQGHRTARVSSSER